MRQPARQQLLSGPKARVSRRPSRRGCAEPRAAARRPQVMRGVGLLDAVIALVILSFGVLSMTRMQGRLLAQGTESQQRLVATQLGDELLSNVIVDVGNATCYTLPQAGACANAGAKTRTATWATDAAAALPGPATTTATIAGNLFTVTINWTGKTDGDARTLQATTDVRP